MKLTTALVRIYRLGYLEGASRTDNCGSIIREPFTQLDKSNSEGWPGNLARHATQSAEICLCDIFALRGDGVL
jgi:hypothetical protein